MLVGRCSSKLSSHELQPICRPLSRYLVLTGSATLPFVIPTRISCHPALDKAACAPFCKGKAHEVYQRHQLLQEIRGSEAEGSAVPRTCLGNVLTTNSSVIPTGA